MKKCLYILIMLTIYSTAKADAVDDGIKAIEDKKYSQAIELLKKQTLGVRGGEANYYLGNIYFLEANDGKRDFSLAYSYWAASADKRYIPAQIRLGDAFLNGELGFKKDKEEAIKYYKTAANSGSNEAKTKLDLLTEGKQATSEVKKFVGCTSNLALPESPKSELVLINWTGGCKNGQLSGLGVSTYQLPKKSTPSQPDGIKKMILSNFENGLPTGVALRVNTSSDRVNVSRRKGEVVLMPIWFHLDVWDKGELKRSLHNEKSQREYGPVSHDDFWFLSNQIDKFTSNKSQAYENIQGVDQALQRAYDAANQLGLLSINQGIIKEVLLEARSPESINNNVVKQLTDDIPARGISLSLTESSVISDKPNKKSKKKK